MTWLVTGGAGYIGAHVVRALTGRGISAVVVDDLSTGRRSTVPAGVPFVEASVLDTRGLVSIIGEHEVEGVIHLAAKKAPAESVADPLFYYRENVTGITNLLEAMRQTRTRRIVLSSSCSVYGNPAAELVAEDAPFAPASPYGQTKVASEWLVAACAQAYGMDYVNLRYFNVAGTGAPDLADQGALNLIPMAFRAIERGDPPQVFGADYDTPDGSCIRDFVHVVDLADAHAAAAEKLGSGPSRAVYNVGTGKGNSVLDVLAVIRQVTGIDTAPEICPRRPGDPVRVVGDVSRIERELAWRAHHDLTDMVSSAWTAISMGSQARS